MYDFIKKNKKHFAEINCAVIVHEYKGAIVLKYQSGFVWVLLDTDFPCRNMYPCYERIGGKSVIVKWENGTDAIPGPSLQRFLDSGKARYVPEYTPKINKSDMLVEGAALLAKVSHS